MMKSFRVFVVLIIFCFFSFSTTAQSPGYKSAIDSFLNYLNTENSLLAEIELKKGEELVYTNKNNALAPQNGKYRIGSITKIFTSIIIFQLIEEQRLSLNTSLNKFYPKVKNAKGITIENLLSHTSGIFNVTSWENYYSTRAQHFSKQQILDIIYNKKPDFKPNKDCSYSNSNYILLGYIIEDLTGKSFALNVEERITHKIGLKETFVAQSKKDIENINSYLFDGEKWNKDVSSDPSLPFAAGAIISTNTDLNKMLFHLFHGNLVSDSSLAKMQQLRSKSIGHGLFKAPFNDKIGWGHTGGIDEFKSASIYFPKDDIYFSLTANGSRVNINSVLIAVLSAYYGLKFNYPVFYHSDIQEPKTAVFTGRYRAKLARLITVGEFEISTAENNYLYISQLENGKLGEKALLERIDANTFYLRSAKGNLKFILDKNNNIKSIVLTQGKLSINCKKIK